MASTEQPNNIPFGAVINPHLIPLASHNNDEGEEFPAIIDEFTISEFIAGYCSYLAIALHEATDWDIYEEYQFNEINNEYDHIHTWVKISALLINLFIYCTLKKILLQYTYLLLLETNYA